jgi:hypothetical protein
MAHRSLYGYSRWFMVIVKLLIRNFKDEAVLRCFFSSAVFWFDRSTRVNRLQRPKRDKSD